MPGAITEEQSDEKLKLAGWVVQLEVQKIHSIKKLPVWSVINVSDAE